jgi:uncharacterized protein YdaU (DUF1376 family)
MGIEQSPAFQFYPKEYLSSEKVRAMSFKERGMYWDLCSHAWLNGSIPADLELLARMLGEPLASFRKHWPHIRPCFRQVDGDDSRLEQPRLEVERRKQSDRRAHNQESGHKGANRRWGGRRKDDGWPIATLSPENGDPIVVPMANDGSPSSIPSPSPLTPSGEDGGGDVADADDFWATWRELHARTQHGAQLPLAPRGREIQTLVDLVTRYPDMAHLARMAEVFMLRDDADVRGKPKSLGLFAYHAPWCDAQLRAAGMVA